MQFETTSSKMKSPLTMCTVLCWEHFETMFSHDLFNIISGAFLLFQWHFRYALVFIHQVNYRKYFGIWKSNKWNCKVSIQKLYQIKSFCLFLRVHIEWKCSSDLKESVRKYCVSWYEPFYSQCIIKEISWIKKIDRFEPVSMLFMLYHKIQFGVQQHNLNI